MLLQPGSRHPLWLDSGKLLGPPLDCLHPRPGLAPPRHTPTRPGAASPHSRPCPVLRAHGAGVSPGHCGQGRQARPAGPEKGGEGGAGHHRTAPATTAPRPRPHACLWPPLLGPRPPAHPGRPVAVTDLHEASLNLQRHCGTSGSPSAAPQHSLWRQPRLPARPPHTFQDFHVLFSIFYSVGFIGHIPLRGALQGLQYYRSTN